MMKAKLKDPVVAQKKGFGHVRNTLKKLLKEPIEEAIPFFYDSAFDYGEIDGEMPLMFIGVAPSLWKKYVKSNKTSKTLVAGRCIFKEGVLSLEIKLGKGGKNAVLKLVNKHLLKPFAKAQFVESVEGDLVAVEEVQDKDKENDAEFDSPTAKLLLDESKEFLNIAESSRDILDGIINGVGAKLDDLSEIIVSDDLIKETGQALMAIASLALDDFLISFKAWIKGIDSDLTRENQQLSDVKTKAEALLKELKKQDKEIDKVSKNAEKLQKVQRPADNPVPPVETSASNAMKNGFANTQNKTSDLALKAVPMFDTIDKSDDKLKA